MEVPSVGDDVATVLELLSEGFSLSRALEASCDVDLHIESHLPAGHARCLANHAGTPSSFVSRPTINDLGTVIMLGLLFSPFTYKTVVFILGTFFALWLFPYVTNHLTAIYGNRDEVTIETQVKYRDRRTGTTKTNIGIKSIGGAKR